MSNVRPLISIVVPCFNEQENVGSFYKSLSSVLSRDRDHRFELIYINDGSSDDSLSLLKKLAAKDNSIRIINLSRNFGKEIALSAGIELARGDAIVIIDGDGQHPPKLIPELIKRWQKGAQVVVGVRESNANEGFAKKFGSWLFYRLLNKVSGLYVVPNSTDFRLIDKTVRDEFVKLTERNRNARGLIDWLGFKREFVKFDAAPRMAGEAGYSLSKLMGLALNSFVSLSLKPLYFSFYVGLVILPLSILLGIFSVTEMLIGDPLHLRITGSAYLMILTLFLVGLVLIAQGIAALYLSHIHSETQNRPLYIIDKKNSRRLILGDGKKR
jgi:glycosyltransferase involved in cell wall biosynthesis